MARLSSKSAGALAALSFAFSVLCFGVLSPSDTAGASNGNTRRLAEPDSVAVSALDSKSFALQSSKAKTVHLAAKFHHDPEYFRSEVEAHDQVARETGIFNDTYAYHEVPEWIRNDEKYAHHLEFLKDETHVTSRGAGYWFWKAPLILSHLEQLEDGDVVVYSDTDLNNLFVFLPRVLAAMTQGTTNLALYQMPLPEKKWSKRDVYAKMCPDIDDPDADETMQHAGGVVVIKKTPGTVQFVQKWKEAGLDLHNINDEPSTTVQDHRSLVEHRHDQSVLSFLIKCTYQSPDRSVFPNTKLSSQSETLDTGNPRTWDWDFVTYSIPDPQ